MSLSLASAMSPLVLAGCIVLAQGTAYGIGHWWSIRRRRLGHTGAEGLGVIGGGILGLTAFVLALTLSLATSQLQDRRLDAWAEANAIRAAWEQANAVGGDEAGAISAQLRIYAERRLEWLRLDADDLGIAAIDAEVAALQAAMSAGRDRITAARNDDVANGLSDRLNDLYAATNSQMLIEDLAMPAHLNLLLIALVIASAGIVGYQVGMIGQPHPLLAAVLVLLWTYVMVLTVDFSDARAGFFRTSVRAHELVLRQMDPAP